MSDTKTPYITRLRPSIGSVPTTSQGHCFRSRQTPEILFSYLPGTSVSRPTNARKYSPTTTQRPSTSTTALPVRISSFGSGTPETGNLIHNQKQQPFFSVGSRLSPLTRRVANESSLFSLGISHRTLLLPTSFRPFPTRQNNSAAPPLQRERFPRSTSVPAPSIATEAHLPNPPCPSPPRHVTQEPPCPGLRRSRPYYGRPPAAFDNTGPNRATVLGSRISRRRSPPGDVSYGLEGSSHPLHLVGLTPSNSSPICPRHRRPSGESNGPLPHGLVSSPFDKRWTPHRPLFTATLARTIPPKTGHQKYLPASIPIYPPACLGLPSHNKPTVNRSRPSFLATPH